MTWIKETLVHLLAVVAAITVAVVAWRLLGIDSEIVLFAMTLASIALEKAVRAHPKVPVKDYVNE